MGGTCKSNTKHVKVLQKAESIEAAARATTNKAEATGKLAGLARGVDKLITDFRFFRIPPDQQDLAILVFLDKLVRDMEADHDAETHGPVEGDEDMRPSRITGEILGRATSRGVAQTPSSVSGCRRHKRRQVRRRPRGRPGLA